VLLGWPSQEDFLSIVSTLSPSLSIPLMIAYNFCSKVEGSSLKGILLSALARARLEIRLASTLTAILGISSKSRENKNCSAAGEPGRFYDR